MEILKTGQKNDNENNITIDKTGGSMKPKYSRLYYRYELNNDVYQEISEFLNEGIKVFWFGNTSDVKRLNTDFDAFSKAFFLQTFCIDNLEDGKAGTMQPAIITDGEDIDNDSYKRMILDYLTEVVEAFNAAQYKVEHCHIQNNIVVKASAGTGKTTVMIDRILYLMHMVPDLKMSDIYMITFTNDAANQMNERLQERLLKKYQLTKNKKYLSWVEQQSQMHISTIDSLAYDLFRKYGTGAGYGRNLTIRQLEKERKDLFKDLLSDELNNTESISSQIGQSYLMAVRIIDDFWKDITRKGYTISELLQMDWGTDTGIRTVDNFQKILRNVLLKFEKKYAQLKLDENAISINDLFFDFGHYLLEGKLDCKGLDMKYLFVDEFQDTDTTQIKTFAALVKNVNSKIFVVGDRKQSIYSFKGATDKAFDILDECMAGQLTYFELVNNYRTSANLMRAMEKYFSGWDKLGYLDYKTMVRPFNTNHGSLNIEQYDYTSERDVTDINAIADALNELELNVKNGNIKDMGKAKAAVIVRGNKRALELANKCRKEGMTVVLNSDKPFFLSDAVRDFYALISSYIFEDVPLYLYNYLMTPYAAYKYSVSIEELELLQADKDKLKEALKEYLSQTCWLKYKREFRLRPVMSVIKQIIEEEDVINNYIALDKAHMYGEDLSVEKKNKQALIDAKVYMANLDKLMELIEQRFDGESVTLYDIYSYLSLMIATNRDELEPDVEQTDDYTCVYIMTIHKSKGLEFDTVVMPSVVTRLEKNIATEIITDGKSVGWNIKKKSGNMTNAKYKEVFRVEADKNIKEQVRMFYVGMTRAVNHLTIVVPADNGSFNWSSLIRKVGYIYE